MDFLSTHTHFKSHEKKLQKMTLIRELSLFFYNFRHFLDIFNFIRKSHFF